MIENLLESTVREIIDRHPETLAVFTGFNIFSPADAAQDLWSILKLKELLRVKKINAAVFTALLIDQIKDAQQYRQLSAAVVNKPGGFNFIAQLPCALKLPLHSALQTFLEKLQQEKNIRLNYYVWSCSTDILAFADYIGQVDNIDDAPDLLFTTDYLINKNFTERFIKKGFYRAPTERPVNSSLSGIDIVDTDGCYNVVAINPVVVVIDCKRLGSLPLPKTWDDLLKPEFEQMVVLNGCPGDFDDMVLLNIYKQYGDDGIAALKRSVRYGMHPSEMIRSMAGNKADLPPIHVMPHFFANTIAPPIEAKVIWMEDGTLITPLSFLVKSTKTEELAELIAFLTGPEFGRICAGAYFPSLHPNVKNRLPANAVLKWLGWDYIRGQDTADLLARLNRNFI
ncbi:MAG TPA: ABC transporter substrate-binding protein [Methylomusa anaerophila]|uniref:DUF1858 domain-containing protein n=1 Tax=Methylomusa anaerophila TaxID=1930071 RepID=A0A348AM02_9FIRM|nr:ABC transporter substrate-binding protein [Methylomusa anaerophila]BBB92100.1 hypothetical protein MAMMFC1_02785 [Methylomusa anaerophila]HML87886.1 ABC transporter substrate-binding protein [Methylomusa anaerophila]